MNNSNTNQTPWSILAKGEYLSRLTLLCFGVWLYAADSTLLATLMPIIIEDISGLPLLSWSYTLYLLGSVITGAITGMFVIRLGIAKSEMIAGILYVIGCIISAISLDMPSMILGRLLQGMGGGGMVSIAFIGASTIFPKHLLVRIIAVISGFWGISSLCGPLIGVYFVNEGSWRDAFWSFAAQGLIVVVIVPIILKKIPLNKNRNNTSVPFARLIVLGISVLFICQASVVKNMLFSIFICFCGVLLLIYFLKIDSISQNSILPKGIINPNSKSGAGLWMISSLFMATITLTVYGPLLMYIIFGVKPIIAGYIIALQSLGWTCLSLITSGVNENFEFRLIRLGSVLVSISFFGLVFVMPIGPLWCIAIFSTLMGMGFGMSWSFVSKIIITSVPENDRLQASSSIPTFMRMSLALGAALSGIIANYSGFSESSDLFVAKNVAFWSFAAFSPLIFVGLFFAWRVSKG